MTFTLDPLPRTSTPSDYTRILFDPSNLPSRRIVGLLACQRDPLLRSLETTLVSASQAKITTPPPPKGKGTASKKKQTTTTSNGDAGDNGNGGGASIDGVKGKLWEVQLNDTVIFPEGGGQPADTGKLIFSDPNGGEKTLVVEGCLRRKLESVHLVRVPEGDESVFEGMGGKEVGVRVELDWERRLDHMSIHTAQHLLSAILDASPYVLPTLSWSMHPYPSLEPPYVELSRSLTAAEAEDVEQRCQRLIDEGRKVWVDVSVQGGEEENNNGNVGDDERQSRGLPKDYAGGVIRHINIEDTDRNACCGTQCPNLSLISAIHIIPPTTSSITSTKLYFTAGPRSIRYMKSASRSLTAAAQILGTGRHDFVERLGKFEISRKETSDSVKSIRSELSKFVIEQAKRESSKSVVWISREERSTNDFEFLGLVATGFFTTTSTSPSTEEEQGNKPILILTSSLPGESPALLLIQSTDQELAKGLNEKIKKVLEGRVKGGGAKGRFMSKIDGKWGKSEMSLMKGIVDELIEGR